MRRLVTAPLLATVLLTAAACGTKAEENPTAATTSQPPATSATSTASSSPEDMAAACAGYVKEWEALQLRALEAVTALISAGQDKAKAAKAAADLKQLFTEMRASADKHVASATNPEFKAALSAYAEALKTQTKEIEAAGQDVEKLIAIVNNEQFQKAVDKLAELCGG